MMGLETIKAISREAGESAARDNELPYVYWNSDEVDEFDTFPFPELGEYVPEGWELVEQHFVDSSGWGGTGEPALTGEQFKDVIKGRIAEVPNTGWAVTEVGQFQLYVGEFRKVAA